MTLTVRRWYPGGGHVEYRCETGKDTIIGQRGPDGVRGPAYGHAIVPVRRVPMEAEALCLRSSTTTVR